ncbi:Ldh family oxidoreductase [Natronorubrum sp. FCH18a]|uniref:Ldh family oxidoreductase n=1 Tax=Natronorubrum sp. FCH18a TaxID=3447018 RepID=UPI003F51365A
MQRITAEELHDVATDLLAALGTPESLAPQVAASLVAADLRGHASHGVIRLSTTYQPMVDAGEIDPAATPSVDYRTEVVVSVDGNGAFGQVTGREAIDAGVESARSLGMAVVGVKNGAHLGRIGEWIERGAEEGMIVLAYVNSGGTMATVAAPGSADRVFATNPIAMGVPTFDELPFPIVLDMATSQVAHGKVTKRSIDGSALPTEWAVSEAGEFVTDAEAFEAGTGALLPLGGRAAGHKGFGLAVCTELFGGIIGGGTVYGQDAPEWVSNAGMFVLVDPLRFSTQAEVKETVASVRNHIDRTSYPDAVETGAATATDRALFPGEPEHRTLVRRREEGIPISDRTLVALADLADDLEIELQAV